MATFSITRRASALLSIIQRRNVSIQAAKSEQIEVLHNDTNGITTLSLAREPVNGMTLEFLTKIRQALERTVNNKSKGIILTSSLPKVFSAGLDMTEILRSDVKRMDEYWTSFQDMWLTLYGLEIPIAAAINGASPAGGCVMAISCEYRVMVNGEHTIGLNESQLGIIIPKFVRDAMISTIGYRQGETALLSGRLFKPNEALEAGLVDELAKDKNDALAKCEKYMLGYAKIPRAARTATKLSLRKEALDWLRKNRELDRRTFIDYLLLPQVQESLDNYVNVLKRKAK